MKKSFLVLGFLAIISISFNLGSCNKDENIVSHAYSAWTEKMTDADSVIYAKARAAYLNYPANDDSTYCKFMSLPQNPYAVRTKEVEDGIVYQFACRDYIVTVYMGNGAEVGKVIEIEVGYDHIIPLNSIPTFLPGPIPPDPRKRDTIIY